MRGQRSGANGGSSYPTVTGHSTSRRRFIAGVGAGTAGVLAGCAGAIGEDDPEYEDGTAVDVDGDARTADEMAAAEAVAERDPSEGVTTLDALALVDHEFVLEDDFLGSTVQGTLTNTGTDRLHLVEVRVRVFGADGDHLGRYLATTGDLEPASAWAFEVILLESPDDIDGYEILALGAPT